MAPIRIKGFLPKQSGGAVMLPADITTLSGSDFDVDKLYVMRPEFNVKNDYNEIGFAKDLLNQIAPDEYTEDHHNAILSIIRGDGKDLNPSEQNIYDLWQSRKEKYNSPTISRVKYDWSKPAHMQSKQARNNAILDIMWSVLTNEDTVNKILNPGGFDDLKMAARIVTLAQSDVKTLLSKLEAKNPSEAFDKLNKMSLKLLDKLTEDLKKPFDPLSPVTQIAFHKQNMAGGASIGMFANHNVHHALMQLSNLEIGGKSAFRLNGKVLTKLNLVMNELGQFISKNNAGYLAASVDNVKDPVLGFMNLNTFTNDVGMLLSRLGFLPKEVGMFLGQPVLVKLSELYFKGAALGKYYDLVLLELRSEYGRKSGAAYAKYKFNPGYTNTFLNKLFDNMVFGASIGVIENIPNDKLEQYHLDQVAILDLFDHIYKSAKELASFVGAMRADTSGGAAGPSIAHTINKQLKAIDAFHKEKSNFIGFNLLNVDMDILDNTKDQIMDKIMNSQIPYAQASYTFGLDNIDKSLGQYFPEFTKYFKDTIAYLGKNTKSGQLNVQTTELVYNALYQFELSQLPFFGEEEIDGKTITQDEKRRQILRGLPVRLNRLKQSGKYDDIELMRRLQVTKGLNGGMPLIRLMNAGGMSLIVKDRLMNDWTTLLYMNDEAANRLAIDLFRYSYFLDGFNFGPNSFMNLAPVAVLEAIPGYLDAVRDMSKLDDRGKEFNDSNMYNFYQLFMMNNLHNRKFAPQISSDESTIAKVVLADPKNPLDFFDPLNLGGLTGDDSKIILDEFEDPFDGVLYELFKFISIANGKSEVYYILDPDTNMYYLIDSITEKGGIQYHNSFLNYNEIVPVGKLLFAEQEFNDEAVDYNLDPKKSTLQDVGQDAIFDTVMAQEYGDESSLFDFYAITENIDDNNETIC